MDDAIFITAAEDVRTAQKACAIVALGQLGRGKLAEDVELESVVLLDVLAVRHEASDVFPDCSDAVALSLDISEIGVLAATDDIARDG